MIREFLEQTANSIGVNLNSTQLEQFLTYKDLLLEHNKNVNLTAITEEKEVILKHFIDSLLLTLPFEQEKKSIIDIGTGAGFPGIPLKIANIPYNITLLDSLNKRVIFLNEVIDKLGLTGIRAIHGRAEDLGHDKELREQFDIAVSRAVAELPVLCELCLPFVKVGGVFVSYKGPKVMEEINDAKPAISALGAEIVEMKQVLIPETDMQRNLVFFRKINPTDLKYPRSPKKRGRF